MSNAIEASTQTGIGVAVTTQPTGRGRVVLLSPAAASVCIDRMPSVGVGHKSVGTVGIDMQRLPTVNVGMVYTSSAADGLEVWWCDQWRMLWNAKTRVLWPEE